MTPALMHSAFSKCLFRDAGCLWRGGVGPILRKKTPNSNSFWSSNKWTRPLLWRVWEAEFVFILLLEDTVYVTCCPFPWISKQSGGSRCHCDAELMKANRHRLSQHCHYFGSALEMISATRQRSSALISRFQAGELGRDKQSQVVRHQFKTTLLRYLFFAEYSAQVMNDF